MLQDTCTEHPLACKPKIPVCVPCWPGCKWCQGGAPCWAEEDWLLRAVLLATQGFFMSLVLVSMLKAYWCRTTRRIRASGLLLLEMILFGSLLLYFPVFILYFKPSMFRCILLRWVRLVGFTIVYGTMSLKIYRVLNVFLSCTAQRVPYMTTSSVLRTLGVMVLPVSWFLCAWTAGVLQNQDRNIPLLITSATSDGQMFTACDLDRWDYMMALAELLFLCWGSLLCSAVKAVPSAFHEPRYMGIAIHNELFFTTIFHLLRFVRPFLHPDWMLSLFFIHTHITITVTLSLLFLPKFFHVSQPLHGEVTSEMFEDEVDLHLHINGSFKSSCWSEHVLDPDDIRDELRKLYVRLEILKTKKMANNNPHLQKKCSSRLLLGRSISKCLAKIPDSMSRQCSHKAKESSEAKGTRKWSGSYQATPEHTRVTIKDEVVKSTSLKLQKCHSVGENAEETDIPPTNCKEKRSSKAESIDVPVVCKSASAHNLSVGTNRLQPGPVRVQKSFSFTEKHREFYPLSSPKSLGNTAGVCFENSDDKPPDEQHSIEDTNTHSKEESDKNIPDQEDDTKPPSQTSPVKRKLTSTPSLLYVCPWEFMTALPPNVPSVVKGSQSVDSEVDSQRPKLSLSFSAPGSPYGLTNPSDHHVFSLRSAAHTLLLAKGLVAGKGSGKYSSKIEQGREEIISQQTASVKLSPCSSASSRRKTPQATGRDLIMGSKRCLVKQAAVRMSSNDSSVSISPHQGPRTFEDSIRQVKLSPMSSTESYTPLYQIRSSLSVPKPEVCPWDFPDETRSARQQSSIADICPWDVNEPQQSTNLYDIVPWEEDGTHVLSICQWEFPEQNSQTSDKSMKGPEEDQGGNAAKGPPSTVQGFDPSLVKLATKKSTSVSAHPTERLIYMTAHSGVSDINGKQETSEKDTKLNKITDDVKNAAKPGSSALTKQLTGNEDICPWDFPQLNSQTLQGQESKRSAVCPWELDEPSIAVGEQQPQEAVATPAYPPTQPTSTEYICPWDFPELLPSVTHNYPKPESMTVGLPSVGSIAVTDEGPCEADRSEGTAGNKLQQEKPHFDIIPSEAELPKSSQTQADNEATDDSLWKTDSERPVHTENNTSKDVSEMIEVDPRGCTAQGARSNRALTRCDALCPWELRVESQSLLKDHDNFSDVFPWEEPIPEEDADAEAAAEAFIFPPDL